MPDLILKTCTNLKKTHTILNVKPRETLYVREPYMMHMMEAINEKYHSTLDDIQSILQLFCKTSIP